MKYEDNTRAVDTESSSILRQASTMLMRRPRSIAEVAVRVVQTRDPESQTVLAAMPYAANDFRHHLEYNGFIPAMISAQPDSTGCPVANVWLAGLVEYLSQKYNCTCPAWTEHSKYFLSEPVRLGGTHFQRLAQTETPQPWKRRGFFCGATAF